MALVLADRVRDTTTTTGTGTVTLSGTAPAGYQTFGAAIGDTNTTYYTINAGSEWEVGIGTYTASGTTLSRDTVLASSNAGSLVTFSAGTKDVFVTYPAEKSVNYDAASNVGIGTTAPTTKLDVRGTVSNLAVNIQTTASSARLNVVTSAQSYSLRTSGSTFQLLDNTAGGTAWVYSASGGHAWYTSGSEKMRLDTGGSLLIGKSSVSGLGELLGVNRTSDGHTAMFGRSGGSQNPYVRFFVTDSGCISSIDANGSAGIPALALGANSVEIVRLTSSRMGVGQNTPGATLDVSGASCQNIVAVSASTVDCATGNYFTKTASGALTWTFTNAPSSRSFIFALQLTNGGSGTQTWPAAVVWNGGTAPTLQTSGTDILIFITSDSGTTWRGVRGWKQA